MSRLPAPGLTAAETTAPSAETSPGAEVRRGSGLKKTLALYGTMVLVSTAAIFLLEGASLGGALRTALVAAIAKTFAAQWVGGWFD